MDSIHRAGKCIRTGLCGKKYLYVINKHKRLKVKVNDADSVAASASFIFISSISDRPWD